MLFKTALQLARVPCNRRSDIGADYGGREALELAPHRQDFVGRGHVHFGRHLPNDVLRLQLVLAIGIRMQKADGNGGTAVIQQLAGGRAQLILVQWREHFAGVEGALLHHLAQVTRHQRLVGFDEHVEHGTMKVSDAAAHLHHITKTLGGDHADFGAAPGEQDIGAKRRAVDDLFHFGEKLPQRLLVVCGSFADCFKEAFGGVLRRGGSFEALQLPGFLQHQTVREGAAYIDGQLLHSASPVRRPTGLISMPRVSSLMTAS